MKRFVTVFGPLAIVLGVIEMIDGIWGFVAEATLRELRPIFTGSFLIIVGVFMIREARATASKQPGATDGTAR